MWNIGGGKNKLLKLKEVKKKVSSKENQAQVIFC
jgi:hypothetical protein